MDILNVILGVHLQSPVACPQKVLYCRKILPWEISIFPEFTLYILHEPGLVLYGLGMSHTHTLAVQVDNFLLESA